MESERSIIDLIETGKSSVLFDEMDFQLQFLLRFSDRLEGGRKHKKRPLISMKNDDDDGDSKSLLNLRAEISSCLKIIDLCTSSIGTDLELSVKHRQLILEEVIAPCLFHTIEFITREVLSPHLCSLRCLQECLLCTVLLLLSRKEESDASRSSSNEYIFDVRVKISTPLLLLICSYRPTGQTEAESISKSNTHLSSSSVTNIHKKRKKTTSLQPITATLDIRNTADDNDDVKNRTISIISDILIHFGVSVKAAVQDPVFQQQQGGCSLYELMTLLLISRLLTAKIHTWASVDLSHTLPSTEYSAPGAACAKGNTSTEESLAFVQSLLRTSIENSDLKCAHEDSYLKLICFRYLHDENIQYFSLQTANIRQLIFLTLSILEMACYQCVENQEFVGNLQTNSELRSAASSGGSITPYPLLQTLCSMIYRMSERIASLPSLCLALSPSHEYEGIAEEELLLASLRMVVACSNASDHTCSEILYCPLPSSLSTAEWLSAFIMQALLWEGELFQLRLELREKPVDDTCVKSTVDNSGTDLSRYVSLAGPLSPTETSVERFVFDLSLSLLSLLSNLLRGAENICIADSLPTFLVTATLRLIDEFMSDLINTDEMINMTNPCRGTDDIDRNTVLDNSLPVAELVLSAHIVLLLFILCENNPSSEIAIINSLPRRSWWLPIRLLKGFISLQGQAGVLLRENLQLVIDCISKMGSRDTIRAAERGAVIAEKENRKSRSNSEGHRWEGAGLVRVGLVNLDEVEESTAANDADYSNIKAATGISSQLRSNPSSSLKVQYQEMRWVWNGSDFVWTNSMERTDVNEENSSD